MHYIIIKVKSHGGINLRESGRS
jgi:hypothetical protein